MAIASNIAGLLGIILAVVFLALGLPVGLSLGAAGFLGLVALFGEFPKAMALLGTTPFFTVANFSLTILPLFILMGRFAIESGVGVSAYNAAHKWLSRLQGGLAIATIFGCAGFGASCGSSTATAAVFTKISLPEMLRHGYNKRLTLGTIAAGGILGMLIPPSTLAVIYGILTEVPISKLLIAGIGPGILMTILWSIQIYLQILRNPSLAPGAKVVTSPWKERLIALPQSWPILLLAVIVLGGIYSGVFTPTEAAGIGCFSAFGMFMLSKKRSRRTLWDGLLEGAETSAMIFLIIIGAMIFSRLLALSGISTQFINTLSAMTVDPRAILALLLVMYLVMGAFLDSISMMSLTLPLVYPLSIHLGFEPVWFGTVVILTIEIGLITPPMGLNVYVVKAAAGPEFSLEDVFAGAAPFLVTIIVGLILLIIFPQIILFLPNLMKG